MFKPTTLSCLLFFSVFSAAGQEVTEPIAIYEEQMTFDLPAEKLSDADILQSLNEVVDQLDSEILAIEAQGQRSSNEVNVTTENDYLTDSANNVINNEEFDNSLLITEDENLDDKIYEDDMDLIDGFDDMEFDESFYKNELDNEQIITAFPHDKSNEEIATSATIKALSNNLSMPFDDSFLQNKSLSSQGVGIGGEDEQTINSLDNSDLMDYMKDDDVWAEDMIDDIEQYEQYEQYEQ
jgi:hypothetical protein